MYAAINSISYEIPDLTMEVNVKGTLNLLEAPTLKRYNVSNIPTTAIVITTKLFCSTAPNRIGFFYTAIFSLQALRRNQLTNTRFLLAGSSTEYGRTADLYSGRVYGICSTVYMESCY